MSKFCEICEKVTVAGRRIQHHHAKGWRFKAPKTKRVFKPNLREVSLDVEGTALKATVCMKCYKKLRSLHEEEHNHTEVEAGTAK
jgi:ribosomal protein L28